MCEELKNEIEAINAIYGDHTVQITPDSAAQGDYNLTIPRVDVTLRLWVPDTYPEACVKATKVERIPSTARKGFGNHVLMTAREVIQRVFTPGQVCLYDLLQELEEILVPDESTGVEDYAEGVGLPEDKQKFENNDTQHAHIMVEPMTPPRWCLSGTMNEKKSVFVARACAVSSVGEVQSAIGHLLATDKRASKATHNISAYRIRNSSKGKEVVYQDCDDDGEDAAGGRLLKLLQMMNVWNVLVVVSRWYGGVKLGPARFGIINAVAREALTAGDFTKG